MNRLISTVISLVGIAAIGFLAIVGAQTVIKDWAAPKPQETTISGAALVEQIRKVNKHIFVEEYVSVPITKVEAPSSWWDILKKFGVEQKFVVLVKGTVPAGIDLSQLSEDSVWVSSDGKRVQLTLPPPQVFAENLALDPENSLVISQSDRCPDLLCKTDLDVMLKQVLPAGREPLIQAAYQSGILAKTAEEAAAYYKQFLRTLGAEEVRVVVTGYAVSGN